MKALKHLRVILVHKYNVMKLTFRIGLFYQGLVHDLSKFSPTEFFESAKYYTDGKKSPISTCKKKVGYSKAWLHHFGRNKHHHEYWYDYKSPIETPIIPYKYVAEMICDDLSAGITYAGKDWNTEWQYNYYMKSKERIHINPLISEFLETIYKEVALLGIKKVVTKKNLKYKYNLIVNKSI